MKNSFNELKRYAESILSKDELNTIRGGKVAPPDGCYSCTICLRDGCINGYGCGSSTDAVEHGIDMYYHDIPGYGGATCW